MTDADKATYKRLYPSIEELGTIYVVNDNLTARVTNNILAVYTVLGIDESVKTAEKEKLGEIVAGSKPAFFRVPVRYRLSGGDLLVSVDMSAIEETEDYFITKIELLKCFGAAKPTDEGYLFVPDGSGSIIENNIVSNAMNKVDVPFYGQDQAVVLLEGTSIAVKNTFPVFGVRSGDHAVFGIVENGAAVGGMSAQVNSASITYNLAYPYLIYHVVDNFGIQGVLLDFYQNVADVD